MRITAIIILLSGMWDPAQSKIPHRGFPTIRGRFFGGRHSDYQQVPLVLGGAFPNPFSATSGPKP